LATPAGGKDKFRDRVPNRAEKIEVDAVLREAPARRAQLVLWRTNHKILQMDVDFGRHRAAPWRLASGRGVQARAARHLRRAGRAHRSQGGADPMVHRSIRPARAAAARTKDIQPRRPGARCGPDWASTACHGRLPVGDLTLDHTLGFGPVALSLAAPALISRPSCPNTRRASIGPPACGVDPVRAFR
jgi:hypothetical protein